MSEIPNDSRRRLLLAASGVVLLVPFARAAAVDPVVEIANFTFAPASLTVPRGTTVTWVNHDDSPHSIVLAALNVHSHPLDSNERFSFAFDQAGSFDYRCGLHPFMQGKVVVT